MRRGPDTFIGKLAEALVSECRAASIDLLLPLEQVIAGCGAPASPAAPQAVPVSLAGLGEPKAPAGLMEHPMLAFDAGAQWVFAARRPDGATQFVRYRVVAREQARTDFACETLAGEQWRPSWNGMWYRQDGFVVWAERKNGALIPCWRIYRLGSQPGDTWEVLPEGELATHLGFSEVTVPAGKFVNVAQIKIAGGRGGAFFFSPQIGFIKREMASRGGKDVEELVRFGIGSERPAAFPLSRMDSQPMVTVTPAP
jgi:hypothetical protein